MSSEEWCDEEERYLGCLSETCKQLAALYRETYQKNKRRLSYFRIPCIVLGSVSGLTSIGGSTVINDLANQKWVALAVGIVSIAIALVNAIENFMKVSELMATSLQASQSYQKLAESITLELSQPRDNRTSSGILFLKSAYGEYQRVFELAPPVKRLVTVQLPLGETVQAPHMTSLRSPVTPSPSLALRFGLVRHPPPPDGCCPTIQEIPEDHLTETASIVDMPPV